MTQVLGVDGCRGAWVAATVDVGGASPVLTRWSLLPSAAHVVDAVAHGPGGTVAGVDVPIGLPAAGTRPADAAARTLLARSRSSVFVVPTLAAFVAGRAAAARAGSAVTLQRAAAQAAQVAAGGAGISAQAWALSGHITAFEDALVDGLPANPMLTERVVEVHPECSFARMASDAGAPAPPPKRSAPGVAARVRLLEAWLRTDVLALLEDDALRRVPVDDSLDALAAAWSASRWAAGTAEVLGGRDGGCSADPSATLPMRIVV